MFLLHITHASGFIQTVPFETAFSRALVVIALSAQPVLLRVENIA